MEKYKKILDTMMSLTPSPNSFGFDVREVFTKALDLYIKSIDEVIKKNHRLPCEAMYLDFVNEYINITGVPPMLFLVAFLKAIDKNLGFLLSEKELRVACEKKMNILPDFFSTVGRMSPRRLFLNTVLNHVEIESAVFGNSIDMKTYAKYYDRLFELMSLLGYTVMMGFLNKTFIKRPTRSGVSVLITEFNSSKIFINLARARAVLGKGQFVDKDEWNIRLGWKKMLLAHGLKKNPDKKYNLNKRLFKTDIERFYPTFFKELAEGRLNALTFDSIVKGYCEGMKTRWYKEYFCVFGEDPTPSKDNDARITVKPPYDNDSEKGGVSKDKTTTKKTAKPKVRKEAFNLVGRKELNEFFNESVIDIIENVGVYKKLGIDFPEAFILEGPPGCGKTFAVRKLEEYLDIPTYHITSSSVGSTYIHETAKKIEDTFNEAASQKCSMVVVDEMESFMPNRAEQRADNNHRVEEVNAFLKCLQTAQENKILVVGMTNFIDRIDPAILRSGRMGTHIKVSWPSEEEIYQVLQLELDKRPHDEIDLKRYASRFYKRPLSDVTAVVRRAAMNAGKRRAGKVSVDDFDAAVNFVLTKDGESGNTGRRFIGFATEEA